MGTICLSLAPILRCQSLTRIQSAVLFIPPALEVLFSVTLVVAKRGRDKKHFILAGEGIAYAILALLDLLTHLVPAARTDLGVFRALDILIGALSFIPLLLFTLFLFLFTTDDILPFLPRRVQGISKYTLVIFIPLVSVLNELGSFISIAYRLLVPPGGDPIIVVGFTNETARSFLDGLVLVLFVIFQALNFSAVFLRLVKAFINQRRIESTAQGPDNEVHLFNGLGWIAAGIKLGAVEGLIGFAQGGFGEALTRRILRFLGRACLVIGVLKGVDTVEDFTIFSFKQAQPKRRSALRALISNPRNSTFQQIGGYDFRPGMTMPAVMTSSATIPVTSATQEVSFQHLQQKRWTLNKPSASSPPRSLVTVRRGLNRAPTLELSRMSDLNIISPFKTTFERAMERVTSPTPAKHRPLSASYLSTSYIYSASFNVTTSIVTPPQASFGNRPRPVRHTMAGGMTADYATHRPRRSSVTLPNAVRLSAYSATSDSLDTVHSLAVQFPGIPPRITPTSRQSTIEDALQFMEAEEELHPVSGIKRTPSDRSDKTIDGGALVRRGSSVKRKPVPRATLNGQQVEMSRSNSLQVGDPLDAVPYVPMENVKNPHYSEALTLRTPPDTPPNIRRYTAPDAQTRADSDDNFRTEADDVSTQGAKRSGLSRIKSVGSAPRRRTPQPTQTFTRESAVAEWFDLAKRNGIVPQVGVMSKNGMGLELVEESSSIAGKSFFDDS